MPLDQLLSALEREAQAAAEQLLVDARAEASRLLHDVDEEIAARRERLVTARVAELRGTMEHAVSEAGREARGEVLRARDRLLARIFTVLRSALPAVVDREEYRRTLTARVGEALGCIDPDQPAVVRCTPALLPMVRAATAGRAGVNVESDAATGSGFRVVTVDGAIEVDGTLESRLEAVAPSVARAVLARLEGAS